MPWVPPPPPRHPTPEEAALRERAESMLEAQRQEAERQRLRDQFAAAALTGLLAQPYNGEVYNYSDEWHCRAAYEWADAMLAERQRRSEPPEVK